MPGRDEEFKEVNQERWVSGAQERKYGWGVGRDVERPTHGDEVALTSRWSSGPQQVALLSP